VLAQVLADAERAAVPVSTRQRTRSSAAISASAWSSAALVGRSNALRVSGRSKVSVPTPSATAIAKPEVVMAAL